MDPARRAVFSEAMYLAMERVADAKHELYGGEIWAMAGGSPRHNRLCSKVIATLETSLHGSECAPLTSDQRVHVPATGNYCYPDITVVCGEPGYHAADADSITNPRLIVEVLSRSTAAHDRGAKFDDYRSISSFAEYVLVWQDQPRVEVRRREGPNRWIVDEYAAGDRVELRSLGLTVNIDALYEGVFAFKGDD